MACTCPETYYKRDPDKNGGKGGLTRDPRQALNFTTIVVACGKCIECRLDKSRDWALRCMHELQTSEGGGCFVTLTYDDAHLPVDRSLDYRHFQLFMHRLRNRVEGAGRFFMCGEYGDNFGRPHYHAILFDCVFDDLKYFRREGKIDLFTSDTLSDIWGNGFVTVGRVTMHSAGYVARYSLKKITGDDQGAAYQYLDPATGEVFDRIPPFSGQSLRPGIGYDWFMRFRGDVFPCDNVVFEGKKYPVPRYYRKLLERTDLAMHEGLKRKRRAFALEQRDHPDNSSRRLRDRWEVSVLNSKNSARNVKL
jgi:hypothetical protein